MTRYFTATVSDNQDPDELGRLMLKIPGISGPDEDYPDWIAPRVTPGAGPGAGWWWIPPVDAIVVVELDAAGVVRWTGGTWGAVNTPPEVLIGNYPRRAGFTSPEAGQAVVLDEDDGAFLVVAPGARVVFTTDPELGGALEPVILGSTFLGELGPAMTEIMAALSALGLPVTNLGTLISNLTVSTAPGATGAPYLSALTFTE